MRQRNEIWGVNCFKIILDVRKLLPEWFDYKKRKKRGAELAFLGNE